ncbi:hypothetical protein J3R30DRAFT_3550743 [Lentinula aciculospora]|uniref:Uncharacterized protein n=1 Tax=Lentinula aciculospora TaxID=153920 RepID=A0A9W9DGK7_9AGAR|nr:hypothetical protein J3R30DRAFT_3550743 [Lentinula aciculospora]
MLGRIGVLAILLIDTIGAVIAIFSCSMLFGSLNKWLVEALFCWALSSAISLRRFTIVSSVRSCPVSPSLAVHLSCSQAFPPLHHCHCCPLFHQLPCCQPYLDPLLEEVTSP